ncbi:hypothetical protein [Streptomyces sp. HB132]|uniref:hypothetical protein n=1 Tax=Streptomyces sp. HB132 TaxID=767388 RepID=UPI00195FB5B1|nr:hypothetical protein [Streptomyces sp. HB132]MBM7441429.1 hypothetical protein [Streptomyces sp. HB132]
MSEIAATTVHEAYAFACMRCGYGWEQAYEIEHHVDRSGNAFVVYKADGQQVPSPLSTPSCAKCGGHVVRIMRAGRVSLVQQLLRPPQPPRPKRAGEETAAEEMAVAAVRAPGPEPHHWHLSDLLRPFHRR